MTNPSAPNPSETFESKDVELAEQRASTARLEELVQTMKAAAERHAGEALDERGRARVQLEASQARADLFRTEVDRLRDELNEIYGSKAWRAVTQARRFKSGVGRVLNPRRGRPAAELGDGSSATAMGRSLERSTGDGTYPVAVSVVMPVYNKGASIRDAVSSVAAQTMASFEIVMWDDGSTDPETLATLDEVARLPFVSLFRTENKGVIAARNSAVAQSRGEFICFLDPDDHIAPTYLEKAVALLRSRSDIALAYPWQRTIGDKRGIWETQDLNPSLIARVNHVPVCAVFRREVFDATGGLSAEMGKGYEDWELWAHAAELGFQGKVIPEPLFTYTHSASPDESRDATARDSHLELAERIGALHPLLVAKQGPTRRPTTPTAASGPLAESRVLPKGAKRPILVALPWFTMGGADRVVEALLSKWRDDGRTVVACTTVPLGPGMVNRFDELLTLTPFAYQLHEFLPVDRWTEFVAGLLDSLDEPILFNVGSPWLFEAAKELKRRAPSLRIVDQQFNEIGHLAGNRANASAIDLTIVAYGALGDRLLAEGRDDAAVEVVYTGVPQMHTGDGGSFRRAHDIAQEVDLVAYVGRLSAEKRPQWVMDLAGALGDAAHVLVIGDGPLGHDLGPDLSHRNNVTWLKHVESTRAALAAADVVVLPSRTEGIPLVALESLALGTPIVATRVGGLPEIEGRPGVLLVDPNDRQGFIEAVRLSLAADSTESVALDDRFDLATMIDRYEQLLDRL